MKWYQKQKDIFANKEDEVGVKGSNNEINSELPQEDHDAILNDMIEDSLNDLHVNASSNEVNDSTSNSFRTSSEITHISSSTKITGNIDCGNDLILDGELIGQLKCTQDVQINGQIDGDIECGSAQINSPRMTSNIVSTGKVEISEDCEIEGHVNAEQILNSGKITGNVAAKDAVVIRKSAVIIGDVAAGELEIERGAKIKGNIKIDS